MAGAKPLIAGVTVDRLELLNLSENLGNIFDGEPVDIEFFVAE